MIILQDISGVSIVANWGDDMNDDNVDIAKEVRSCEDYASNIFSENDQDRNGLLNQFEWTDPTYDLNVDNQIDIKELKQGLCSCDSELEIVWYNLTSTESPLKTCHLYSGVIPFPERCRC